MRHVLHADDAAAVRLIDADHLLQAGNLGFDQVIGEMHHEGLITHHGARAKHRMPEAERRGLANVDAGRGGREYAAQRIEQVFFTLFLQRSLELGAGIEMILDCALRAAGDEHQGFGARGNRFFDRVLNERLVDDRQHLLRGRLGCRQKTGAASGDGKDGGFDGFLGHVAVTVDCMQSRPLTKLDDSIGCETIP